MFSSVFICTIQHFTNDISAGKKLWDEIADKYSQPSRHYHTLNHLDFIYQELQPVQKNVRDWNITILAIAYHDIVYNVLKDDNEEKSADHARRVLSGLVPDERLGILHEMIMATKKHGVCSNPDANYFTDADLSILGTSRDVYLNYTKQIRKEYKLFPDIIYKEGRRKVIQHFLKKDTIFKTPFFSGRYETQANENLRAELKLLSGKEYG